MKQNQIFNEFVNYPRIKNSQEVDVFSELRNRIVHNCAINLEFILVIE